MSHEIFDHRHYVIIPYSEVNNINFDQVIESSIDTVRKSVDNTKTFVKYKGEMPSSITTIEGKSQEYYYEEMRVILSGEEWTMPI